MVLPVVVCTSWYYSCASPVKNFYFQLDLVKFPDSESAIIFLIPHTVSSYKSLEFIFEFRICSRKILRGALSDVLTQHFLRHSFFSQEFIGL